MFDLTQSAKKKKCVILNNMYVHIPLIKNLKNLKVTPMKKKFTFDIYIAHK